MRNDVWNEMGRTYMKKSSEKHLWIKFTDRNYEICSLVRFDKKNAKIADRNSKMSDSNFWAGSVNLQF
jgi:hypothetical protein